MAGSGLHRSGRLVCATAGTLKVLQARTLHLTVRVTAVRTGRLTNHATVTSRNARDPARPGHDPGPGSAVTTAPVSG